MTRSWSTRLAAGAIVAALMLVGTGFLLSAAYMALAAALSPPLAALAVGSALIAAALLAILVTSWVAARVTAATPERRALERDALAQAVEAESFAAAQSFASGQRAPELGAQLGVVLRNLNPVTIAAIVLGIVAGLLKDRVHRPS